MAAWHLRSWVHFLVLKEKGQTTNASSWCAHFTLPLEDNPSFLLHLFLKQQIISAKKDKHLPESHASPTWQRPLSVQQGK